MGKVTLTDSFYKCDECGVTSKERDGKIWGIAVVSRYDNFNSKDSVFYKKLFCSDLCMSNHVDNHVPFLELTANQLREMFEERYYPTATGNTD
jgi:hypothetical protein